MRNIAKKVDAATEISPIILVMVFFFAEKKYLNAMLKISFKEY